MSSLYRFKIILSALFVCSFIIYHFYPSIEAYQVIESKSALHTPVMDSLGYAQMRLKLNNGLRVWLISAPHIERSCIGVAVGVGSSDDPLTSMGLSHFCEHMVFLGSEAYPELEGTDSFQAKHNGEHNACTYPDRTIYGFSCASDAWKEAANRMAGMLIAPLMKEEALRRERNAVNEELQNKLSSDGFMALSMVQSQTSETHPLHKLLCGSNQTLANVNSQELKEWVNKYYVGDNMAVYAISSLPLKEMIQTIEEAFSPLAKGKPEHAKWPELFEASQTHKQLWGNTPADRVLFLAWSIPAFKSEDASIFFMQKAIGHPYKGGIQETLKQKGWISGCQFQVFDLSDHNLAFLALSLTEKGIEEIDQVKALTYDYLDFLKTTPWPEVWLSEYQNAQRIDWQMHVNDPTLSETLGYASMLYKQPLETFPDATHCPTLKSFQQAQESLKSMAASSCIEVTLCPQSLWPQSIQKEAINKENWKTDPWIGTRYLKLEASNLSSNEKTSWSMPQANPLFPITVELPICPSKDEFTYQEHHSDTGSLKVFNNPSEASSRDSLVWAFRPFSKASEREPSIEVQLYWSILAEFLGEKLQALNFEAGTAGQGFSLIPRKTGLEMQLNGYCSSAQDQLLIKLSEAIHNLQPDEHSFQYVHQNLCDQYEVLLHEGPIELFSSYLATTCLVETSDPQTYLNSLKVISFDRFQQWLKKTQQTPIRHDLLVVSSRPMDHWISVFEDLSKHNLSQLQEDGLLAPGDLPFQTHWKKVIEPSNRYSHVRNGVFFLNLWPSSELTSQEALETFYCLQMLEPDFAKNAYFSLRTEQQLGYVVKGMLKPIGNEPTLVLLVLSSAYDEKHLSEAMETFTKNFTESLAEINDETFESMKKRLLFKCYEPSRNSLSQLHNLAVCSWQMGLDPKTRDERLAMIEKISKQRYIECMRAFLSKQPITMILSPVSETAKN